MNCQLRAMVMKCQFHDMIEILTAPTRRHLRPGTCDARIYGQCTFICIPAIFKNIFKISTL